MDVGQGLIGQTTYIWYAFFSLAYILFDYLSFALYNLFKFILYKTILLPLCLYTVWVEICSVTPQPVLLRKTDIEIIIA